MQWGVCVAAEVKFREPKLRRSRPRVLRQQGPEEVVAPVGAALGHGIHSCPHLVSGGTEAIPQ